MCIGQPLQTLSAWPGGAEALGRRGIERVDTRLVGDVQPGDWLLVHQGAARERLSPERAAEIASALALLEAALAGDADGASAAPDFALPSALSAEQLAALTGASR